MKKQVANFFENITLNQFLIFVVILVVALVVFKIIGVIIAKAKEKKLQENPTVLNIEHAGSIFKVRKVISEEGIILLALNPSVNYPSGGKLEWFKIDNIPVDFHKESATFKVLSNLKRDGILIVGVIPF